MQQGLIWDAMLKVTKTELELIKKSRHECICFEKDTRGGISYNSTRYSKANNKYLKSHDTKYKSKYITYLHANNLYGYAVPKFLPTSGFKWIDPKNVDLDKHTSDSSKGCVS